VRTGANVLAKGFYLITTDILGPYGTGFTMGTLGWGPGERDAHAPYHYALTGPVD
jgi:hypothetical protein